MKLSIGILFLAANYCFGQGAEVRVVFNNTLDIKNYADKIPKLKTLINGDGLLTLVKSNPHIKEKNLFIRIAFFDRGYLGEFKLRQEHSLSSDSYVEQWKNLNTTKNALLFLFVKAKDATDYVFRGLVVSAKLESEYLLPLVTDFINKNLSGDVETIIGNAGKYLAKVLVPVWNDKKMAQAEMLINNNPKYRRGHVNLFHNEFSFGFFNMKPVSSEEVKNMKLVNCWSKANLEDKNWFFSKEYIFTDATQVKNFDPKRIYNWDISFEENNVSGVYIFKDAFLYNLLSYIEGTSKHHPLLDASEWNWRIDPKTSARSLNDFNGFSTRKQSDKLVLFFDESYNLKEGEELPAISGSARSTWCNVFACDLSNEILFGNIFGDIHNGPWGKHSWANVIHYRISNDEINFKEVSLEEAWIYTMKGFVVYLTMFNENIDPNLLNTDVTEEKLGGMKSGHVATCFPKVNESDKDIIKDHFSTNNYVIQAGHEIGTKLYKDFLGGLDSKLKAHIYLGYLTK